MKDSIYKKRQRNFGDLVALRILACNVRSSAANRTCRDLSVFRQGEEMTQIMPELLGQNLAFIEMLYMKFVEDPDSVPTEWREYFERWEMQNSPTD